MSFQANLKMWWLFLGLTYWHYNTGLKVNNRDQSIDLVLNDVKHGWLCKFFYRWLPRVKCSLVPVSPTPILEGLNLLAPHGAQAVIAFRYYPPLLYFPNILLKTLTVIRQLSDCYQSVIKHLTDSYHTVIRQLSDSY